MPRAAVFVFALMVGACESANVAPTQTGEAGMSTELIVLAPPADGDPYYADVWEDIFAFHVAYARQIAEHDRVLVLAGDDAYEAYAEALGTEQVIRMEMLDIWMRDFSPSNASNPVLFRYTAEGQGGGARGQREADAVQEVFADFASEAGLMFESTDLLNDGGNFVDDYAGRVVLSRKFLRDNNLTEAQGRARIRAVSGAQHVAFIDADEQGGLEHADGVVAFIDENTLAINAYPEDPAYAARLRADLEAGLPDVVIHEIVTPYDGSQIYDERFGSACGLYTNMLVTPDRIYLPHFGIDEDAQAVEAVQSWTSREVIPVQSGQVCQMGGGVRCMSWQLRGTNADALLAFARQSRSE
ncbi:MAG: agmatine deiminase family protein [Bacteroidota bacterium]